MKTLGETVKKLRQERGWSLSRLSSECKIPVSTLHGIEKGSNPSYEKITTIASAFGISTKDLIGDSILISDSEKVSKDGNRYKATYLVDISKLNSSKNTNETLETVDLKLREIIVKYAGNNISAESLRKIEDEIKEILSIQFNKYEKIIKLENEHIKDLTTLFNKFVEITKSATNKLADFEETLKEYNFTSDK